jgi:predicted DNA binding CopG/RHH family protein
MGTKLTRAKANAKEVVVPKFSGEAEEAEWWDAHRSQVEAEIRRRMKQKRPLTLGGLLRKEKPTQPVTLRIAREDLETARHLAAQRGLRYQTYIKMLLRGALAKERQAANARRKPSAERRRVIARSAK